MPKQSSFKISFFVLCFGAFLNWMSYGLVYPIFAMSIYHHDPVFLDLPLNTLQGFWLGILLAACPLAQFFSAPSIGAFSDRKGRKPVLQITTLLIAIGALLSAIGIWERSYFTLIFGRLVTGVGAGDVGVINASVADFSPPSVKAKNFALIAMANGIGFSVGPFLGGKLAAFGFHVPFLFALAMTIANFGLISFFFSETIVRKKKDHSSLLSRFHNLWKTTVSPRFRIIFLAFFAFCFGWSFYWEFIPVTWIKNYGLYVSQIGNFYAFGSLIYVLSNGILIRPILNRFKSLPILFFALAFLGSLLFLLLHAKVDWYWPDIAMQQFLIALIFPVGIAIVSDLTPASRQGEILGAFQSLQAFAFAATPLLGGPLLNLSYNTPLLIGSISMFLACLILFIGYRKRMFSRPVG
jgi:DHA1 family tetracycline resistance protein-like MFS transporter